MTYTKTANTFPFAKPLEAIMKDFLNDFPSTACKTVREDVLFYPPVNISESAQQYNVELAAPGYEKSDFKIKLVDKLLTVSADKNLEAATSEERSVRKEFTVKSFKRSFTINEKVATENISAKYENGILRIVLPKKDVAEANAQHINVN